MKKIKFSILILCLLSSLVGFADEITYEVTTNYGTYSTYALANAYDGDTSTYFWSNEAQATGKYILITFTDYVKLTKFSTYSSSSTDYPNPCNELQVSADCSEWTKIGTFSSSQTSEFSDITNATKIKYIRIYAKSDVEYWLVLNEITMTYIAAAEEESTQIDKTYSRSNVTTGTWESFCLPMNVDLDELQKFFDKIYIPKNAEKYDIYDVVPTADDDSGELSGSAKSMLAPRKASTDGSSTITCTAEAYSEEEAYWTDEEEAEAVRCCFAYSAQGSNYYHFFIADYSDEEGYVIPQGTPFFAHISAEATLTDNTLTLNGYLYSGEEEKTGIVDKSFKVYSDQTLMTVDADKSFYAIGELTDDDTFSLTGTLYTINPTDGSFVTTTKDNMEQNHAYLMVGADDAEGILIYPTAESELLALTEISVTDPDEGKELHLTDASPDLVAGTYKAGNIDYTRTVNNYYAGFYVPFDVDLSTMTDNFQAVYTPAGFAIYNINSGILTTFYKNIDMTGILPAYTPFLAVMTTDDTGTKKSQNVCLKSFSSTALISTKDKDPIEMEVYDYGTNGGLSITSTNFNVSYGGTLNNAVHAQSEGYNIVTGADGSWGYVTDLKAFREYVIISPLSSSAKTATTEVAFIDRTTKINDILKNNRQDAIYDLSGRKLLYVNYHSLPKGIYIFNGKKIIK